MPIKIQSDLPARATLQKENIFVMTEKRATTQDIRPLKIAIVNLMPTKQTTETQLLRLLSNTPLQIDISLVRMVNHESTHVSGDYLSKFYIPSSELYEHKYDGMIITGAPVEQIPFEKVDYWKELCNIMDYAKQNVTSTLYICWGAYAGLYHNYGIGKLPLDKKRFGVLLSKANKKTEPLLRGFDDTFPIPTSRHTTVNEEDFKKHKDELILLAKNNYGDIVMAKSKDNHSIFMTGHLEYDTETLATEYWRDVNKNLPIDLPENYFPNNDTLKKPVSTWRSTAHLFYSNWLNYYVYQATPFIFAE